MQNNGNIDIVCEEISAGYQSNNWQKQYVPSIKKDKDEQVSQNQFAESHVLSQKNTQNFLSVYPYGLNFQEISVLIKTLDLPLKLSKEVGKADVILALRANLKQNAKLRQIARAKHITIYTIHSSTIPQITRALKKMLEINAVSFMKWSEFCEDKTPEQILALNEARWAIEKIVIMKEKPVELLSSFAETRKLQHDLVKFYNLKARSLGEEPYRRLRIYPN